MRSPLRLGLILDSLVVSDWVAETIHQLVEIPDAYIALILLPSTSHGESPNNTRQRDRHRLFDWYMQYESSRVAASLRHAGTQDITPSVGDVPRLHVQPTSKRFTDIVSEQDVALIRAFHLDILVRFGMRIIRGALLGAARYGVWSYHHGDNSLYRGGPPGFWEMYDREPVSGVTLQVLTEELDGGLVISKSFIRTHDTSPVYNRENLYWSGISLMRDAVRQVCHDRPEPSAFFSALAPSSKEYKRGILKKPDNVKTLGFLARQGMRYAKERMFRRYGAEQWSVGVCKGSMQDIVNSAMLESSWYVPGEIHFVADPFPVERDDTLFIFVEEFVYRQRRGKISVLRFSATAGFSEPVTVLDASYHLSYPYVFEHENSLLMVPESEQSRRVVLYECVEFPHRWRERSVLLESFPGIDTSLVYHEGLWWLFTTDGSYENSDNHLLLFYSEKLDGPYRAHPFGRVKSSLFGSRMAGRIVNHSGKLYRPGQNCVKRYGGSVVLHEILALTPERYEEQVVAEMQNGITGEFRDAFHTINQCGEYTVIDGSRRMRR